MAQVYGVMLLRGVCSDKVEVLAYCVSVPPWLILGGFTFQHAGAHDSFPIPGLVSIE